MNIQAANNTQKIETNPMISMSYEDIAKELNLTVKEVKDAEQSAIRKMRHPRNGKIMKEYLGISLSAEEHNGFWDENYRNSKC